MSGKRSNDHQSRTCVHIKTEVHLHTLVNSAGGALIAVLKCQ